MLTRRGTDQSQTDLPPEVIEQQRDVQSQGEPLLSTQEHDAKEAVDGILWQHQLEKKQRYEGLVRGRKCSTHSLSTPTSPCKDPPCSMATSL